MKYCIWWSRKVFTAGCLYYPATCLKLLKVRRNLSPSLAAGEVLLEMAKTGFFSSRNILLDLFLPLFSI